MLGTGALYAKYIFKDIDICRPAYWDFKHAIKEIFTGKNEFMKTIGFSYKKMVIYVIWGAIKYTSRIFRTPAKSNP